MENKLLRLLYTQIQLHLNPILEIRWKMEYSVNE